MIKYFSLSYCKPYLTLKIDGWKVTIKKNINDKIQFRSKIFFAEHRTIKCSFTIISYLASQHSNIFYINYFIINKWINK